MFQTSMHTEYQPAPLVLEASLHGVIAKSVPLCAAKERFKIVVKFVRAFCIIHLLAVRQERDCPGSFAQRRKFVE